MIQIHNHTGVCCHPDCDTPVSQDEILCPEHKRESERAAMRERADARDFYYGPRVQEVEGEDA